MPMTDEQPQRLAEQARQSLMALPDTRDTEELVRALEAQGHCEAEARIIAHAMLTGEDVGL